MKPAMLLAVSAALVLALSPIASDAQDGFEGPGPAPLKDWSVIPDGPAGGEAAAAARELSGRERFSLAESYYDTGEYEKALENYYAALPLLEDAGSRARAHERLAFIYAAFGESDRVYDEFVESLKLDSSLALDPDLVSPKVYQAYIRARDEVVREGTLVVNCEPSGAEVFLEGEPLGEAPVRKPGITEGEYTLEIRKPGYETSVGKVVIKKDFTITVDDKLVAATGAVDVSSDPPGVAVLMDGRSAGVTPVRIEKVSGGPHTLTFRRDYFEQQEVSLDTVKGGRAQYRARMKRRVLAITGPETGPHAKAVLDALSGMEGVSVAAVDMSELVKEVARRGLDPGSLGFLSGNSGRLDIEDYAVMAGIMEDERVELAVYARETEPGEGVRVDVSLYSTASESVDVTTLSAPDADRFAGEVEGYVRLWREVSRPVKRCIGVRVVDRASGGVEVVEAVPGFPAASSGIIPGDLINSADGVPVVTSADLHGVLGRGTDAHTITYMERGRELETMVEPVDCVSEVPVGSGRYLYNLALVENAGFLRNVPAADGKPDDARGAAALNLGNVYMHMGDYTKAVETYGQATTSAETGVCVGTALYRMGQAYERLGLWPEAAYAYRRAMMLYPDARLDSAEGTPVGPLARERAMKLYEMGLTTERWWM